MFKANIIKINELDNVIELLQQISNFRPGNKKIENFKEFLKQDSTYGYCFYHYAEFIGYGQITFERRVRGGIVAHLEDIVVKNEVQGKGLGKKIIQFLIENAKKNNAYKVVLSCKSHNVKFYEKCGLNIEGKEMVLFIN